MLKRVFYFALVLMFACSASADLVGYWSFDEGAGTVANDGSGNNNHGEVVGGAQWVAGKIGGALAFDGVDDMVVVEQNIGLPIYNNGTDNAWSVAMWVNGAPQNDMRVFSEGSTTSNNPLFNLGTKNDGATGQLDVYIRPAGLGHTFSDAEPFDETWHHIAWVDENGTVRVYIDGVLDGGNFDYTRAELDLNTTTIGGILRANPSHWFTGMIDDVQIYNHALTADEVLAAMKGISKGIATDPAPADEQTDIPRDVALSWTASENAVTHDVYLGTVFDDVNDADRGNPMNVLVSESQTATNLDPDGLLDYGQTYYWRIDEVNGAPDNTIFKGDVWSFTIEPFAYAIEGVSATSNGTPDAGSAVENMVNGSGLDADDLHSTESSDMWLASAPADEPLTITFEFDRVYKMHQMLVWNYNVAFELLLGFGVKDATVEYSTDGAEWTVLGDVVLTQAPATAGYAANTTVELQGVPAQYVRLTINGAFGMMGKYGLSEVRFTQIPAHTREPDPADGEADVAVNETVLSWRAGRDAVSHEVSLGADADTLELIDTTSGTTADPGVLDLAATYYWKADAIQDAESWEGNLWSFMTQTYLVVDGFESYIDDEGGRIYETWVDGYGVNGNGSTVGHLESPFAEQDIVKSGKQSMPLFYDNSSAAMSEAELTLSQDWTASGVKSLTLSFQGAADNTGGQLYVKINGTKIAYDGAAAKLTKAGWNLWSIDLATAGNVSNVTSLIIGVEGAGASGVVYIDDVRLYPEVLAYHRNADITGPDDTVQGVPNDDDWPTNEHPALAVDDDVNTKYLHRKGGAVATGIQITPAAGATVVTGIALTTANDVPSRDPITFELSGSNAGIDGPYTLIATGDIVDFAGESDWPRFAKNETAILFDNDVAYTHYQIVFPTLRGADQTLMQIAEIELIGQ